MRRDVDGSVRSAIFSSLFGLLVLARCGDGSGPDPVAPIADADASAIDEGGIGDDGDTGSTPDDGAETPDACGVTGACPDEDVPKPPEDDGEAPDVDGGCANPCAEGLPCDFCVACANDGECAQPFKALNEPEASCLKGVCSSGYCTTGPDAACQYDHFECDQAAECKAKHEELGLKLASPTCETYACESKTCAIAKTSYLCCEKNADCNAFQTACSSASCEDVGDGTKACVSFVTPDCCATTPDLDKMGEAFEGNDPLNLFPPLPQGWTAQDLLAPAETKSEVNWRVHRDPDVCLSGGSCVNVGWSDGTSYCYTYYDGPFQEECQPQAGQNGSHIEVRLTSAEVTLEPADRPWILTFRMRLDGEPPASPEIPGDHLIVHVDVDGLVTQVFDSIVWDNTTSGAWKEVTVNLSPWAGKTVNIQWTFDTGDGFDNNHKGVFLDDVRIKSICQDSACEDAAQCVSKSACLSPSCSPFQQPASIESNEGVCLFTAIDGCESCFVDSDCAKFVDGKCTANVCVYPPQDCKAQTLWAEDFLTTAQPASWTVQDDPLCNNLWTVTDQRADSGTYSFHFGDLTHACGAGAPKCSGGEDSALCPQYDGCANAPSLGKFETGPVSLPAGQKLLLTFKLLLSTEWDQYADGIPASILDFCKSDAYCPDQLRVFLVDKSPQPKPDVLLWDSYQVGGTTKCAFKSQNIKLNDYAGKKVAFRFEFDTYDEGQNYFEGVYIDNIQLKQFCDVEPCDDPSDCLGGDPCHEPVCDQGTCKYDQVCECYSDLQCNQGDNQCIVGTCNADKTCTKTISTDKACCDAGAVYWSEPFDADVTQSGWKVETNGASPVKWQWTADGGKSGGGLYFGDAGTKKYADGANAVTGSITTPVLQLAPGGTPLFQMDLWASTEFDTYTEQDYQNYSLNSPFDRLAAFISSNGGTTFDPAPIWRSEDGQPLLGTTKSEGGVVVWLDVAFPIPKDYAGKKIVLRFDFDSGDGSNNASEGLHIDNARISQACPETKCFSEAWCKDSNKCTQNACNAGTCEFKDAKGTPGCCFPMPQVTFDFESGTSQSWTLTTPYAAPVAQWQADFFQPPGQDGKYSLHFGNNTDGNYSGCPAATCGVTDACLGTTCLETLCDVPKGIATSPKLTIEPGVDYSISFDLFADLFVPAGAYGSVEGFTVKLMYQTTVGAVALSTLLCHAGECDVAGPDGNADPCKSGINFQYPGCLFPDDPGDYGQWIHRSFKLSEVLCAAKGSGAETFKEFLVTEGAQQVWIQVEFAALDNFYHCTKGLFVDDVQLSELCDPWNATCK